MNTTAKRSPILRAVLTSLSAALVLAACNQLPEAVPEDVTPNLAPAALKYVIGELEMLPSGSFVLPARASADGSVIVGWAHNSAGQQRAVKWNADGQITELGTLGGARSFAQAVSADGSVIVGWAHNSTNQLRAVKWNAAGQITDLGTLGGTYSLSQAINADGSVIVGYAQNSAGQARAVKWNAAGQITDLGTLGGASSVAHAVSTDGSAIVGYAQNSAGQQRTVKWNADGQITELGTLEGGAQSYSHVINADGSVIVGLSSNSAGQVRAVKWNEMGEITELETLPGGSGGRAYGVSADGSVIVGDAYTSAGPYHAVKWNAAGQITDLGTLGGTHSLSQAINADGSVIVGWAYNSAGRTRAVKWNAAGQITDLGTLGGAYSDARVISADGSVVVGYASNSAGQYRPVRWSLQNVKDPQTITFDQATPTTAERGSKATLTVTSNTTTPIVLSASPENVCTVSGFEVSFLEVGDCTVTATQAATDDYNAGTANRVIEVKIPADTTPPVIVPTVSGTLGSNGWYTSDVTVSWSVTDAESAVTNPTGCDSTTINADTSGTTLTCSASSAGGASSEAVTIKRDATAPTLTPTVSATQVLLNGSITVAHNASDATSGLDGSQSCSTALTDTVGGKSVTCQATDNAGNSASASVSYGVIYSFSGFSNPVDNSLLNKAKAGQAIPLKWRLTDASGAPVSTLANVTLTVATLTCSSSTTPDAIEEYASGSSSLQNLGDGYYQFNWKTPTTYADSCKTLRLDMSEGIFRTAAFQFTK